jgi:integrase
LGLHLAELVDEPLIALDVPRLAVHQQLLLERGATPTTVREVFVYLSGILQIAVEHGHLPANPVRAMRKVKAEPNDEVNPLSPVELERLIAGFQGRDRAIVLLAGHLGLRPLEVRAVLWGDFRESTLMIGRSRTKATAQRMRTITVPKATAAALKLWRMESGRPADSATIVGDMSANAMKCWGRGPLRRDAEIATGGREDITLYTLRHSHASACHYAGFTLPSAARRLGHGASLHLDTYAHVIDALEGRPRYEDLDALIAAARADLEFPQSSQGAVRGV